MNKYIPFNHIKTALVLACLILTSLGVSGKEYVIISELMYDSPLNEQIATGVAYSNGEYIELFNAGIDSVNLANWSLKGGGSTEVYTFPSATVLPPKGYLIVAYQYSGSGFTLDQLYSGFTPNADHQVQYQKKIILSNSGEPIKLRDISGITKDSIYIDGTSNKTKVNRLSAENADNTVGLSCVSLQRKTAVFDAAGNAIPNNTEWTTGTVTLYSQNTAYAAPAIQGVNDVSLSPGMNYIVSVTPLDATGEVEISGTQVTLHNEARSLISIGYFDGLGRPLQTVQQGATPQGSDLATLTEYDGEGRELRQWLPVPVPGNKGAYINGDTFKSAAGSFGLFAEGDPNTENILEASPLNRVLGTKNPGTAWHGKPTGITYGANEGEVAYYYVDGNGSLARNGYYETNTLYKTVASDEDGKKVTEYKDKLGKVVMKRSSTNVDTYYVYNDLYQLSYVLPPLAADNLTATTTYTDDNVYLKQYGYLYKYDERGNCTYKRLPGCEPIYMVYDKAERLVLSQDGNQRLNGQWTVTRYDALGRMVYTALLNREVTDTEKETVHNSVIVESIDDSNPLEDTGYTCNLFTDELSPLTVNYYDSYGSISDNNLSYDNTKEAEYGIRYTSAKGLLTGSRTYLLDGSGYTEVAMYYDYRGRAIQSRSTNHLGGYDMAYTAYSFTGKPLKTYKTHGISGESSTVTELYTYTYDKAERPLVTTYSLNGGTAVTLTDNTGGYDELGRLTTKKRHNATDTESFAYNIRNWTTQISSGNTGNNFTENLYYNTNLPAGATACYNGNIAASTWTYGTVTKGYNYGYDNLNRLLSSSFQKGTSTQVAGAFDETFTYDKMGNILTLKRKKDNALIDDLTFGYKNGNASNQLDHISDAAGSQNSSSVKEYQNLSAATSDEMAYDANGNMVKDLDRNIVTIKYNLLNLPEYIQFGNGNVIKNLYDAGGQKLRTDYYTYKLSLAEPLAGGEVLEPIYTSANYDFSGTEYIGNIEYTISKEGGSLGSGYPTLYKDSYTFNRLYNTEGYAENLSNPVYYYYRKDHLGDNREVWQAPPLGGGGGGTTVQRTQYYPSGLPWAESLGSSVQKKKYNGKEFVEMHGLDMYDYGARFYYPASPVLSTVDPLCGLSFNIGTYVYCLNNPVNYIDPTGMSTFVDPTGKVIDHRDDFDWNIYYVNDIDQWEKNGKKKDGLHIIGIEDSERDYKIGEHWLFGGLKNKNNKKEEKQRLPSTYNYKNGEKVVVNGNTYQLHNCHWVKLTGELVDVACFGRTGAGVYIPNQANFVDRAIYEDDMKLLIKKGTDGIIPGLVIEGVATKTIPKANGYALILQFYYNMFNGMFNQLEENSYHNSQVKQLKSNEKN